MPVTHAIVSLYPTVPTGDVVEPGKPVVTLSSTGTPNTYSALLHTDSTPGDNGFTGATCPSFRTVYGITPSPTPHTESWWNAATPFEPVWNANAAAAGDAQDFPVEFSGPGTYYFSVRFQDTVGNVGDYADSVEVTL